MKSVIAICAADKAATVEDDIRTGSEASGRSWAFKAAASATGEPPATHLFMHAYMTPEEIQELTDHPDCQVVSYDTTDDDGNLLTRSAHAEKCLALIGLKRVFVGI